MFKKGDIIETEVLDTADKAQTFARMPDGTPLFIQGPAATGDRIRARITGKKKNRYLAVLCEVLSESERRTTPQCPVFGICGGCKWQHLKYEEQLRIKHKQVQDALHHLGDFKDFEVLPALPAPETYGYRNKVDFSFTDMRWLSEEETAALENRGWNVRRMNADEVRDIPAAELGIKPLHFALGFHVPGCFSKAIDLDRCDIAAPEMNTALNTVRTFCLKHDLSVYSTFSHTGFLRNLVVRYGGNSGELMVNLVTSTHKPELMQALCGKLRDALGDKLTTFVNSTTSAKNTVAFGEEEFVMHGEGFITDRLGDFSFRISPNSFFQTNTAQAETLYAETVEAAGLAGAETVYDLCCGTGTIAIYAAPHCKRVLGIELVEDSVRDARKNAAEHGADNCTFLQMDMKDFRKRFDELTAFGLPDVVITDPPRAGMHPKSVEAVLELAPAKIVYVSCNPASLARDGKLFCENGAYRLVRVQPVDMFPHTNHIESVALFEKR